MALSQCKEHQLGVGTSETCTSTHHKVFGVKHDMINLDEAQQVKHNATL